MHPHQLQRMHWMNSSSRELDAGLTLTNADLTPHLLFVSDRERHTVFMNYKNFFLKKQNFFSFEILHKCDDTSIGIFQLKNIRVSKEKK